MYSYEMYIVAVMGLIAAKIAGRSGSSAGLSLEDRDYPRMDRVRYYMTLGIILTVVIGYDAVFRFSLGAQDELFGKDIQVSGFDQESMSVPVTDKDRPRSVYFMEEDDNHPEIHVQNGWDDSMGTKDELFPDVDIPVKLADGFELTLFDKHVLRLSDTGHLVLHQMWRNSCVLNAKIQPMKTWEAVEGDRLRVIFWTDESMEYFMQTHFNGTDVMQFWRFLDSASESGIKKSDFFRVVIVWFYGSIYADLDIQIKASLQPLLDQGLTTMMWEGVDRYRIMTPGEYKAGGQDWRTLMLSGFVSSGIRFSDFLGFYINWSVRNFLSGRKKQDEGVLNSVGPIAEAEAYKYYVSRVNKHDRLFRVMAFEEFLNVYGDHLTESTWNYKHPERRACTPVTDVYSNGAVTVAPNSAEEEYKMLNPLVEVVFLHDSVSLEKALEIPIGEPDSNDTPEQSSITPKNK